MPGDMRSPDELFKDYRNPRTDNALSLPHADSDTQEEDKLDLFKADDQKKAGKSIGKGYPAVVFRY